MSVTTNAIIAYGISLDEDQEIPWETGDDTEVEEWWLKVNGYEPPFKMFDEHGMWINGVEPPQEKQDVYWNHRRAALEANPLPPYVHRGRPWDRDRGVSRLPGGYLGH